MEVDGSEVRHISASLTEAYLMLLAQNPRGPWLRGDPLVDEIRAAGEELNRVGGIAAMTSASATLYHLTGCKYSTGPHLNTLWDGIGLWQA